MSYFLGKTKLSFDNKRTTYLKLEMVRYLYICFSMQLQIGYPFQDKNHKGIGFVEIYFFLNFGTGLF